MSTTTSHVYISTLQNASFLYRWYCTGHFKVFQIRIKVRFSSKIFGMLLCLPCIHHFYISCPTPPQQPHQCGQWKPGGWEKLRHRWAVHNIVYVPDSSFTQPMPYSPCRHSSVPAKITNTTVNETTLLVHSIINVEKMCFRNVVSLLEKYGFTVGEKSEMEYGGKQNWRLPEATGGSWRRPKMSTSKALS